MYVHACIGTSHGYTYICTYVLEFNMWTAASTCICTYLLMPLTHPLTPQLLVDADILPTLLLLLDHSNSAVQTNAAWALMVRGGRGREGRRRGGEGRGGEGTKSQLPVLMNVVNNVHCFGFIRRTCHTEVQGKSLHSF